MAGNAWIVRMKTGGGDVTAKGLSSNMLLVGWSKARGLDDPDLDYDAFRARVHAAHYAADDDFRRSGRAASMLWKFMREMKDGDRVVVPGPGSFSVAVVAGEAFETEDGDADDTAHRRPVKWLNGGQPIPRRWAQAPLVARMKARGTVTDASDLADDIDRALGAATHDAAPSGAASLRDRLVGDTQKELLSGYFDERRFEELVRDVLLAIGAASAHIVHRRHDVGIDIRAEFAIGGLTLVPVGVQAKYWRPDEGAAGREPIDQLAAAMEDISIGMVVTTTSFTDEARAYAEQLSEETGKELLLFDGVELSQLIIDQGLRELVR